MLLYFILGILFAEAGIPLLEAIITLFIAYLEKLKGNIGVELAKYNKEIETIENEDTSTTRQIGFSVSVDEVEDEDE